MVAANVELCRELYQLSGWSVSEDPNDLHEWYHEIDDGLEVELIAPRYSLTYLLRKQPRQYSLFRNSIDFYKFGTVAYDSQTEVLVLSPLYGESHKSPEDAAAKLAIELFKQGILERAS